MQIYMGAWRVGYSYYKLKPCCSGAVTDATSITVRAGGHSIRGRDSGRAVAAGQKGQSSTAKEGHRTCFGAKMMVPVPRL